MIISNFNIFLKVTPGSAAALTNRLTGSSGTLLSEVLSLKRLRIGRNGSASGSQRLLRESKDLSEERPLDAPQNDGGDNHNSGLVHLLLY